MTITPKQLGGFIRQLAAYAGLATQFANTGHFPANVRAAIVAVSGAILAIDHYSAKP
jgi:hypothetical protein